MFENNEATSVSKQDPNDDIFETLVFDEPSVTPDSSDDIIQLVAPGEWKDPRTKMRGRIDEKFGTKTNAKGKLQCSVRVIREGGNPILVSAFDEQKVKKLSALKLGWTYTFKGKLKTKTEIYQGQERTSEYLNL